MSIVVSAVHRRAFDSGLARRRMLGILQEITPERLRAKARWEVRDAPGHVQGTLNFLDSYPRRDLSLCQGKLYDSMETWWQPGTRAPDGSFAILREDAARFEAVSDPAASRMLWYYHDEDLFVVSNSERALTMYCGRFDFNRAVVPWVVSTGTRGLGASYNSHLRLLPPAAIASLDKATWRLEIAAEEQRFAAVARSHDEHLALLEDALRKTFDAFGPEDARHGIIALSGGTDSRALACYLTRDGARWRSYSVGSPESVAMPASDVSVAAQVAKALGLRHRTLVTERTGKPLGDMLRGFVLAGEGRHDHMTFLGGDVIHRTLDAEKVDQMIRGDEAFGHRPSDPTPIAIRHSLELLLCGEVANLKPHLAAFGLEGHELPQELHRRPGETLPTWRDRLYHQFRLTTVLAALNESKAHATVDAVNPLLSRRALDVARSLPDELRTDKALFRELVAGMLPDIAFAGRDGAPIRLDNLRHPEVRRAMRQTLGTAKCESLFGRPLASWVRAEIHPVRHLWNRGWRLLGKARRERRQQGAKTEIHVDPLRFAFRIYVATTMVEQLEADARFAPADARMEQAA